MSEDFQKVPALISTAYHDDLSILVGRKLNPDKIKTRSMGCLDGLEIIAYHGYKFLICATGKESYILDDLTSPELGLEYHPVSVAELITFGITKEFHGLAFIFPEQTCCIEWADLGPREFKLRYAGK